MRATFVVANYPPSVGGAQFLVQRVAEGLVAQHGWNVRVVTTDALLSPGGSDPGRIPLGTEHVGGVEVVRLPVARRAHTAVRKVRQASTLVGPVRQRFIRWSQPAASGPMGARLAIAVARSARDSDVLVGVSSAFLALPAAALSARRAEIGCVSLPLLHLSGAPPARSSMKAIRSSDVAVALTEFEQEWMHSHGLAGDRCTVIPAGCEPQAFPEVTPTVARSSLGFPERPTVGYVGRMAKHKGIDTLAASMQRVWQRNPEVNLLIAGNRSGWSGFDEVVARIAPLAGDRLIVRDRFAHDKKAALFAACDVIAFPSREESFGMVTLESWCARRPVVAGDIGAVRSLIRPGIDGALAPVDDDRAWSEELLILLGDDERRHRYGQAGRERVEREFTWPHVVDRWHEVLAGAASLHGRRVSERAP